MCAQNCKSEPQQQLNSRRTVRVGVRPYKKSKLDKLYVLYEIVQCSGASPLISIKSSSFYGWFSALVAKHFFYSILFPLLFFCAVAVFVIR